MHPQATKALAATATMVASAWAYRAMRSFIDRRAAKDAALREADAALREAEVLAEVEARTAQVAQEIVTVATAYGYRLAQAEQRGGERLAVVVPLQRRKNRGGSQAPLSVGQGGA